MGKKYKAEEIVMKLREIELSINKDMDCCKAFEEVQVRLVLMI